MSEHTNSNIAMDHEYDGIREYDNPLPGWWVWMFTLSIVVCVPYVMWYHFGNGPTLADDYEAEIAAFAEQLLATYGTLEPDEATIVSFIDDETAMAGMRSLFKSKCAQCHLADGSGNVGPNLTDDTWTNVKTLSDIPNIIRRGVPARGMPEWGSKLTQTQIVLMSSYVAGLRRHPVAGKAPEGSVVAPWPTAIDDAPDDASDGAPDGASDGAPASTDDVPGAD